MMVLVVLLLLGLTKIGYCLGSGPDCDNASELANCGWFKIVKIQSDYIICARRCPSGHGCIIRKVLFNRNNICGFCSMISEMACTINCEKDVDSFLKSYCMNATSNQYTACSISTPEAITQTPCTSSEPEVITVTVPKIITVTPEVPSPVTCMPTTEQPTDCKCPSQEDGANKTQGVTNTQQANTEAPGVVLGALTGLLTVMLATVTTGWVWTCWTVKKWRNETQLCTQYQDHEEKRSYPNPTYDMTTISQPVVGTATQGHSQEVENRQTYNVLNRNDDKGRSDVNNTGNFHGNENYNHLDLQDNHMMIIGKEGESGEEHVYHVLEKSGDDDYEDPDKDLRENRATDYEIPVPLEEI